MCILYKHKTVITILLKIFIGNIEKRGNFQSIKPLHHFVYSERKNNNMLDNFRLNRFIPESVPWLIAKDREIEAKRILQSAAKWNNVQLPEKYRPPTNDDTSVVYTNSVVRKDGQIINRSLMDKTEDIEVEARQYNILDILASPKLRLYSVIMVYLW